jgi:hypothetical protein
VLVEIRGRLLFVSLFSRLDVITLYCIAFRRI